jgi:tRNA (guanine-N7-)-methyltransferase
VDLGCGKGRFLLAHARNHPDLRLLGIERKLRRIRKIDRKATRQHLRNIRLLRMEANYAMRYLIPAQWIDLLFVYFPDPWPKDRHRDHRLLTPDFMDVLDRTLSDQAVVHFATDHYPYFEEVMAHLLPDPRWTETDPYLPTPEETSDFELLWRQQGKRSYRYSFVRA